MISVGRKDLTRILLFNYNSNAVHKVLVLKMCRDLHRPRLF